MAMTLSSQVNVVLATEHVKPGKGPAYVQVKLKNLESGAVVEKRRWLNGALRRIMARDRRHDGGGCPTLPDLGRARCLNRS